MPTSLRAKGAANVFTIAASLPFAETLARGMRARLGSDPLALADAVIYVPTRRATRTLSDVFAAQAGGAALLPEIRPLGDVDEEELLFDPALEALDLPPAISPIRRRLLLAMLVRGFHKGAQGESLTTAQAAGFAKSLAAFFDEVETHDGNLSNLRDLDEGEYADHWRSVREFLSILETHWPKQLAAEGCEDPAARRNVALKLLAARLQREQSSRPVIAAGSTGSIPATAALLGVIARLPNGAVVLPGLDRDLDERSWNELNEGHPQYGLRQLLGRIGVAREDVRDWVDEAPANPARELLLREILRPAPTTDAWRAIADGKREGTIAAGLQGLRIVEAASPREEALTIALILREALETPDQTSALVTPDRNLARRVAAELGRWNIEIDDSAGVPLGHTPPGVFLCLVAEAANSEFAPVPLLALLKHPLCAFGQDAAAFRAQVRILDRAVLRGPRPDPGVQAIERLIMRRQAEARSRGRDAAVKQLQTLQQWFAALAKAFLPFAALWKANQAGLRELVDAHLALAEQLAATIGESGARRLWSGPAGEAAARLVSELREAAADLPPIEPGSYPILFRNFAREAAVRPAYGRHPRLAILGAQEARMQRFDLVVLGGLNEGTWPRAAANDPWLSRPMRRKLGLEQPERAIGLAAHDFAMLAAGPRAILTRAQKVEGAPTVPSRWWQRLTQLSKGLTLGRRLADGEDYVAFAKAMDAGEAQDRLKRPAPRPPVALRPRELSFTEIEKWLRDPYAIYARHILRLRPLDPLDGVFGPRERGTAMHKALEKFLARFPKELPPDAGVQLSAIAEEVFAEMGLPKAVMAVWQPRFDSAAGWFADYDRGRRRLIASSHGEIEGKLVFDVNGKSFTLHGRADRIDILTGGGAAIVDYKTGQPPSQKQVELLASPQLPLEGVVLAEGGFGALGKISPTELLYVHFSGRAHGGSAKPLDLDVPELVQNARDWLRTWVGLFDDESTPYLSRYWVERTTDVGDYDHLARVREWSISGSESGEK